MKTIGQMLSAYFDDQFAEKALGYSKFYDSWTDITEKNGIASAASYSRIKNLEKGIVTIEVDHPGWKQILQTKQSKLLYDFRYRFPNLDIAGICLVLSRNDINCGSSISRKEPTASTPEKCAAPQAINITENTPLNLSADLDAIDDEDLKEKLIRLGSLIKDKENKNEQ